jgi:hypothetical protein
MLCRGNEPVVLGRRAVSLLRMLLERPGAAVSKDALMERAWSGQSRSRRCGAFLGRWAGRAGLRRCRAEAIATSCEGTHKGCPAGSDHFLAATGAAPLLVLAGLTAVVAGDEAAVAGPQSPAILFMYSTNRVSNVSRISR